jgi:RNA polymerase sigma-70 factor (ECF subfamily)
MSSMIETESISMLQKGDLRAFDRLYHFYSPKLYRFAFSLLKNNEDAEGIVQEVFLILWKKRTEIDSTKSFKSYLFTISHNLIIDQLRKRLKEKEYQAYLERYFNSSTLTPEQATDYSIIKSQVDRAVEELPKKRKQIYRLSRENGLSHKEISKQLNISHKTVENQITLSLKHVRGRLGTEIPAVILYLFLSA